MPHRWSCTGWVLANKISAVPSYLSPTTLCKRGVIKIASSQQKWRTLRGLTWAAPCYDSSCICWRGNQSAVAKQNKCESYMYVNATGTDTADTPVCWASRANYFLGDVFNPAPISLGFLQHISSACYLPVWLATCCMKSCHMLVKSSLVWNRRTRKLYFKLTTTLFAGSVFSICVVQKHTIFQC